MYQQEHQEYHTQMWPQPEDPPSIGDGQPPLCRSYSMTTAVYCDFGLEDRLAFSSGRRQLRWWHNFSQMLEIVLGRYGAVSAERSHEGVCGVLGVSGSDQETDAWRELKAVQCALDLLDAIQEMHLPGGGTMPARIGLHMGPAADGLVGCANTLQYRLAGPALSVAKALAKAAPWDGVLASADVVGRQHELEPLWRPADRLHVSGGAVVDTFLLPIQAAPAYAQHPSAPQAIGPSDWTACKQPCAAAAWRVHDGGSTALHGGLPPGYQTWVLSARATAASFAGRGASAAPEPGRAPANDSQAIAGRPTPAGAAASGAAPGLPKKLPAPGRAAGSRPPSSPKVAAAAAAAAYRLLQDDAGSADEEHDARLVASSAEDTPRSGAAELCEGSSQNLSEDSSGPWEYSDKDAPDAEVTGTEAPMGLGAFPSPRPRRWISVAPSAWGQRQPDAGAGLHKMPHVDDRLLLAGAGQLPAATHRPGAAQSPCSLFPASAVPRPAQARPARPSSRSEAAARAEQLPAGSHRHSAAQPPRSFLPAAAPPEPVPARPAAPSGRLEPPAHTPAGEIAATSSQPQLRLRGGRQSQQLPEQLPQASCSRRLGSADCKWRPGEEEPCSCWRGVAAAALAKLSGRGGRLILLDLPDGTTVLQDARLQFTDAALEGRFQAMWARHNRSHDRAVMLFFLAMFAMRELRLLFSPGFAQVAAYTPGLVNVAVACFLAGLLALMHINQELFERQRSKLTLLMRIVRTLAMSWHHIWVYPGVASASLVACRPGFPFLSVLVKNALPWAAMSLCEVNLMSAHLLGDAFGLVAAAAQAPWLCGGMCSRLGHLCCSVWVVVQALGSLLLTTAMMYVLERRVRGAFLHSVFAPCGKAARPKEGYEHMAAGHTQHMGSFATNSLGTCEAKCCEEAGCSKEP